MVEPVDAVHAALIGEAPSAGAHPEEMKANVDLRIGRSFALNASGRMTPAGLVCAAIAASAILLSAAALVRAVQASKDRGAAR